MNAEAPLWIEAIVAALLVLSGVFVVVSAVGLFRGRAQGDPDIPPPLTPPGDS